MRRLFVIAGALLVFGAAIAFADSAANAVAIDTVWTLMAAVLVFLMQAGFAMLETGFTRAKNAANIMMKNLMDFSLGSLAFWAVGFGIMFGARCRWPDRNRQVFSLGGAMVDVSEGISDFTFWMFQVVFAATAATIVSGAVAERTQFKAYLVYSVFITALIYPVVGHWIWGGGWLSNLGMIDFAGSTVVHSVGGWAGLAGAIVLGAREGQVHTREGQGDGEGHPGPQPAAGRPRRVPALVRLVRFQRRQYGRGYRPVDRRHRGYHQPGRGRRRTRGAGACLDHLRQARSHVCAQRRDRRPGRHHRGLRQRVAGQCGGHRIPRRRAGRVGGSIHRPGAHGRRSGRRHFRARRGRRMGHHRRGTVCSGRQFGGTNGLFFGGGFGQLGIQIVGVLAVFAWTFVASLVLFSVIKATIGLRVSRDQELRGLDIEEHGAEAYTDFEVYTTR